MPQLGEIKKGTEIGIKSIYAKYIWHACVDCGKERWGRIGSKGILRPRCHHCAIKYTFRMGRKNIHSSGSATSNWKGGRFTDRRGYIHVWLSKDDFFYPMVDRMNHVLEHRLIMAKSLGRNLHRWEIVHHKNHNCGDNRIENLQLVSDDRHRQITILDNKINHLQRTIDSLQSRITLLEANNIRLEKSLEEYRDNGIVKD